MTSHRDDLSPDQLEDDSLHALLQMAPRAERTADEFVRQVEERLAARVVPPPIAASPVVPPPVILPARRPLPSVQRSSPTWPLAAALAVLLIFVAGLGGVWYGRVTAPVEPVAVQPPPLPVPRKIVVHRDRTESGDVSDGVPESLPSIPVVPSIPPEPSLKTTPVVWRVGGPQGGRLPAGRHELVEGAADVAWGGGKLAITAPASLEVRGSTVSLERGQIFATDPLAEAAKLVTPTARITLGDGAFFVSVGDEGKTEVKVESGELSLVPGTGADLLGLAIRLSGTGWCQAEVAVAADGAGAPVTTMMSDVDKRFCGVISVGGEPLQFNDAKEFADFSRQVAECFESSPERLASNWPKIAKSLAGLGGAAISVKKGDEAEVFRSLDDLIRLVESMPRGAGGSFQGSINMNGTETKFTSPAEFEAARKRILGDLPIFGELMK